MSSQDGPPEAAETGQHHPGGVHGDFDNGLSRAQRSQANLNHNNDAGHAQRRPINTPVSRLGTAYVRISSESQEATRLDNVSVVKSSEEEQQRLHELTQIRDSTRDEYIEAQRQLDEFEEGIKHRLRQARALHESDGLPTNQQLRQGTPGGDSNSWVTTSTLGKRNNNEREDDEVDDDDLFRTDSGTKRLRNLERTNDVQALPGVTSGNAVRTMAAGLGRPRHPHPFPSVGLLQVSNELPHQGHSYGGHSLGLARSTELSHSPSFLLDTAPNPRQLPQSISTTIDGDVENTTGLDNQGTPVPDLQRMEFLGYPDHGLKDPNSVNNHDNAGPQGYLSNQFPRARLTQQSRGTPGHPFPTNPFTGKRSRDDSVTTDGGFSHLDEGLNEAHDDDPSLDMPLSKRQKKRQGLIEKGKDIPKDDEKPKGKVEYDQYGNLYCRHEGKLEPAAYHHERRLELYAREAHKGQYNYPQAQGMKEEDKTSFHPAYVNIDMKVRERRPHLSYQWSRRGGRTPYYHPGLLRDSVDGKLLLDKNNHPILDWPELPKTISAQIQGFWFEFFYRLNNNIRIEDIIARLPKMTQAGPNTKYREIPSRSAYGNSRSKDRLATGSCAWEHKEGTKEIIDRYLAIMPNKVLAEIAHRGTTTWFRDLKPKETNAICYVNKGKGSAPLRAGNKKLAADVKEKRQAKSDPEAIAIYARLLREKHEVDQLDPWDLAVDPGFAFDNPAINMGYRHLVKGQTSGPTGNSENDSNLFEGDTTLVGNDETTSEELTHPFRTNTHSKSHLGGLQAANALQGNIDYGQAGYHWMVPITPREKLSITNALEHSRATCRMIAHEDPPHTNANDPYMKQFNELEVWLKNKLSPTDPDKELSILEPWENWYGGWDDWQGDTNHNINAGKTSQQTSHDNREHHESNSSGYELNYELNGTQQAEGFLSQDQINALQESSQSAGAHSDHVAASTQRINDSANLTWMAPSTQESLAPNGFQTQAMENPFFSQAHNDNLGAANGTQDFKNEFDDFNNNNESFYTTAPGVVDPSGFDDEFKEIFGL